MMMSSVDNDNIYSCFFSFSHLVLCVCACVNKLGLSMFLYAFSICERLTGAKISSLTFLPEIKETKEQKNGK